MGKEAAHLFNLGILIRASRGIGFDVILYGHPPGSEESLIFAGKNLGGLHIRHLGISSDFCGCRLCQPVKQGLKESLSLVLFFFGFWIPSPLRRVYQDSSRRS
jgi:hypothetical protein